MATGTATPSSQREDRTIILAIDQEEYEQIIPDPPEISGMARRKLSLEPGNFP